jgi:hypothetical protein
MQSRHSTPFYFGRSVAVFVVMQQLELPRFGSITDRQMEKTEHRPFSRSKQTVHSFIQDGPYKAGFIQL